MKALIIANGPAYGSETTWNALRLAGSLARREHNEVKVFFMGDAVVAALAGQKVPDGYYHLDRMVQAAARHGAEVGCCGTCLDARGIADSALTPEARRSTLEELSDWTEWADKVITF